MAINFFNIGDMMGLCNEYSQIKSSTYKKLVNTYYDKVQKGNDLDDISELFSKNNSKNSEKNKLNDVRANSDSLSASVTTLLEKGKNSVFNKVKVEKVDEKTGEKTVSEEYDVKAIKEAVSQFVSDYNKVLDKSSETNSTKVMKKTLDMIDNTKIYKNSLEKIGISIGSDNKLTIDEEKFESANMTSVKSLFNDENSLGRRTINKALQISTEAYKAELSVGLYSSSGSYNSYDYSSLLNMYL